MRNENSDDEPISHYVDSIIQDAIRQNASDIHIEPNSEHCRIRFRCDGLLSEKSHIPIHFSTRVISRLKILAHLNIAERRLPQDGRLHLVSIVDADIRISTCPTLFGEKVVLRLLNKNKINLDINSLGLLPEQQNIFMATLNQPQGLILVTGPTGSGKTMSLYAALHYLNAIEKNISTVEDPVEMALPGINQVSIHPSIQLHFAEVLRALLRQDPDIIMIGEIRDNETALIAMQAAQTGHLVLSTLHTNNAIDTIFRLQTLGTRQDHFMNSVSCIIGQRLVRKLCKHCKQAEILPAHGVSAAKKTYRAIGCTHCHQGYRGRIGIFECICITSVLTELIAANATRTSLLEQLKKEGQILLWEAGLEKVRHGLTTQEELLRVIGHNSFGIF